MIQMNFVKNEKKICITITKSGNKVNTRANDQLV